jgi:hypothetical protein
MMTISTHHSAEVRHLVTRIAKVAPADFVPLHLEQRTHVSTAVAGWHLLLQQQSLRAQACSESHDPRLKPVRHSGRLLWPVAGIKAVLGVA